MLLTISLISFVSAFIFALGGVGAAIILIPILISLGIPPNMAKPVGLFYNTVSLTGASFYNLRHKNIDIKTGIPIITFSFIFAAVGAYLSKYIPQKVVLIFFICFLLFSSAMFLKHKSKNKHSSSLRKRPYLKLSLIGITAGLISGILGVGGGGIISPLMLTLGYDPKEIVATTAFIIPFSSFSGFITYWAMGTVNWTMILVTSLSGLAGATLGTKFTHSNLNSNTIKKILAAILLLLSIKLILKIL